MTPDQFISKWRGATLTESAAAQSHFIDLCRLLDEPTPTDADPQGAWYCFERGATKSTGGQGWADVWKRDHFGWEYKGKRRDLTAAFVQLQQYALALDNPPILAVSDMETFILRTNWTNTVSETITLNLDDLRDASRRQVLKWALSAPEKLKPGRTRQALTEDAAAEFAELARRLRARGHPPDQVAHVVNRLVFCLFADDTGLLPDGLLPRMLDRAAKAPAQFEPLCRTLFAAMAQRGGMVGFDAVPWFNGGLFDSDLALPLEAGEIGILRRVAAMDWSEMDPSIMGTLFERGLDPDKRSQLGAHYTDREKIALIVEPVVIRPLARDWDAAKAGIAAEQAREAAARTPATRAKARAAAQAAYAGFLDRIRRFRVLDPACGSGNFLYVALLALKDLEHRAGLDAEALGLQRELPGVGPEQLLGIEINPYAAELARIAVWIGHIQWARRNGFEAPRDPVLRRLDTIECRDAVLSEDGTPAEWPAAEAIIGNPPFLGDKAMIGTLGEDYTRRLRAAYAGRVPGGADLVCYWFEKAREAVEESRVERVGLVSTNSIRGGSNRKVLDKITETQTIFDVWSDEPWTVDGAAVRVSLVSFGRAIPDVLSLDGEPVSRINSDLSDSASDLVLASRLRENLGIAIIGRQKDGPIDIDGDLARSLILQPSNPNGRPNTDVVRPWVNGRDLSYRPRDMWIVDFREFKEVEASFYAAPFAYLAKVLKPLRENNRDQQRRTMWWRPGRSGADLFAALDQSHRYIATVRHSKHRLFVWCDQIVVPDSALVAIARDDDTSFGVLHSRFHEAWALRLCTWIGAGNDPRYTPTTTFETFPFPDGLTPNLPAASYAADPRARAIAAAARALVEARDRWLNPPEWVDRVPEVVPGFPDRLVPRNAEAAARLKSRTLTALYNTRGRPEGQWLDHLHAALDAAVAAAYGWPADITEEDALSCLLALNQARAGR